MSSILVVDDEVGVREYYTRMLVAAGYLTLEARTAEEALDLVALTQHIRVVVADLHMPGHGGGWLLERLRYRFPQVAVVLATADANVPGTLSLLPAVVNYIVKPVSREQLLAAVAKGLAWHEQQVLAAVPRDAGGGRPIEAFLDRKLTRGHGDDGDHR